MCEVLQSIRIQKPNALSHHGNIKCVVLDILSRSDLATKMSFLTVGGDGSQRPTFFELIAADRLMPSLKAAIVFSLSVRLAHRRHLTKALLQQSQCIP